MLRLLRNNFIKEKNTLIDQFEKNSNKKIENFVKKYKTPIFLGSILALGGAGGYIGYEMDNIREAVFGYRVYDEMHSSIKEVITGTAIFTGLGLLLFSYALSAFDSPRNRIGYKHYD